MGDIVVDDVPPEQLSTSVAARSTHFRYTIQIRYWQIDRTSTASDAYNKVSWHVRVIMSRTAQMDRAVKPGPSHPLALDARVSQKRYKYGSAVCWSSVSTSV